MSESRARMPSCPLPMRLALFVGVALRLVFLASKTLQIDEGWTILVATDSNSIWENTTFETAYDSHPIIFYYLYRILAPFVSFSDWAARIPMAMFSIASLLMFRPLLQKAKMPAEICDWSLWLFAVLPVNIFYANDARVYALVQLVGLVVFWFYLDFHETGSRRSLIAITIGVALSCMFDVIGCAPVIAILLDNFFRQSEDRKELGAQRKHAALAVVCGVILCLPYVYFRYCQHQLVGASDQQFIAFTPNSVLDNLMQLSPFGIGRWHAASLPFGLYFYAGLVALVLGMLLSGLLYAIRNRDAGHRLCWLLLLLPFVGQFMLIALMGGSPLYRRYLIGVVVALVPILVAGTLHAFAMIQERYNASWTTRLANTICIALFLAVPLIVSCAMGMTLGDRPDWRTLYHQIGPVLRESDGFLHTYASPAPRFVTSPLLAYAKMDNDRTFPAEQFLEPKINLNHMDESISMNELEDWATAKDQADTEEFVRGFAGKRIWSFRTPLTLDRPIDLRPFGNAVGCWRAAGLEATLYQIKRESNLAVDGPSE